MAYFRKWAALIGLIITIVTGTVASVPVQAAETTAVFRDVHGHWAEGTIGAMVGQGILDGFPDGTFRPDEPVAADQFIKMVILSFSERFPNGARGWKPSFLQSLSPTSRSALNQDYRDFTFKPSETGYWAKPFLDLAGGLNFIARNQFSDFKAKLKREEVAEILYYTLKETEYTEDEGYSIGLASRFGDFQSVPARAQRFVAEAYAKGIMEGYPNGYFGIGQPVTRSEALRILERLSDKAKRVDVEPAAGQEEFLRLVPTKDGSYKRLPFPSVRMAQAFDKLTEAGKLRGTNYDLQETVLRLFRDTETKEHALGHVTGSAQEETSLWVDPPFHTYGVTIRLDEGVLDRNKESIFAFTDFVFGYNATEFRKLFQSVYDLVQAGGQPDSETKQIGIFAVEARMQPDGKTLVFSILEPKPL